VNFNQPTGMAAGWFLWSQEDCLGLLTGALSFVFIHTSTEDRELGIWRTKIWGGTPPPGM
jgi:dihydroorotate dehydrogenase